MSFLCWRSVTRWLSFCEGEVAMNGEGQSKARKYAPLRDTHDRQCPAQRAGLLGAQVEGQVLLVLVELAQVGALLLVHDRQHTGNALADTIAVRGGGSSAFLNLVNESQGT